MNRGWVILWQNLFRKVLTDVSQILTWSGTDMWLSYAKEIMSTSSAIWAQWTNVTHTQTNRPQNSNIDCKRQIACQWFYLILLYSVSEVFLRVSFFCLSVMLVDCDHVHGGSRKVISRISRVILPLLGVLTLSKNSKGNFVRIRSELGCGKKKTTFFACNSSYLRRSP